MKLYEIKFIPKIGKIYTTSITDPRKSDLVGVDFAVIGFRLNGRQVKVVFFNPEDIDNFDIEGEWDIKIDPNSEREPTAKEQKAIDRALATQKTLPKEH